jgi:hypothetical protein
VQAKALESGRESGNVKLASRALRAFPEELWRWDAPAGDGNWWQVCAISKLDLSHNELVDVPEKVRSSHDCRRHIFWRIYVAVRSDHHAC